MQVFRPAADAAVAVEVHGAGAPFFAAAELARIARPVKRGNQISRIAPASFEDVNFPAHRPGDLIKVRSKHPESRPGAGAGRDFHASFD